MLNSLKIRRLDVQSSCVSPISALLTAVIAADAFVGIYDDRDYLRYANAAFLDAFKLAEGEVATFSSIILNAARDRKGVRIDAPDPELFVAEVQARRRMSTPRPRQRVFPVDFVDDRWFWCTETLLPTGWIVLCGSDMTALKVSERELVNSRDTALHLSHIDELTEVRNRRFSFAALNELMRSATADGLDLSVAILDLDHFKCINDRFGHETGDRVLRSFALHCDSFVKGRGLVGRLGGEEFIVLLPSLGSAGAKRLLDEVRDTLPAVPSCDYTLEPIKVSFSAGVAELRLGERREEVLARADRALYKAKQLGRSRVELCKEMPVGTRPISPIPPR
ncbi:GGDEF domain-containing protein [Caballeronia grimmiae]|uniref:GGDEF domain-containing protein n=1 Tax=Caballeronia grimmiae TaxID=1071679 RepID=UPI0038BBB2E1